MLDLVRKLLRLMSPRERKKVFTLLGATVILGLVEMAGVASIMPFLAVVGDPSIIDESGWLSTIRDQLGFTSHRSMLLFLGVLCLATLILRNAFSALVNWGTIRLTWEINHGLSQRLLGRYLSLPYTFYLSSSTSAMGMNILSEVNSVVSGVLAPFLRLVSASVIAVAIVMLLVYADAMLAFAAIGFLGLTYGLIHALVRRRLKRIGDLRLRANRGRYKAAQEALGGIKDVKIAGREADFLNRYASHSGELSGHMGLFGLLSVMPRYLLEVVAFGGLIVVVLYLLGRGADLGEALSMLGLFAFAGYRLVPALQNIFTGYASLSFSGSAVETLDDDLSRVAPVPEAGTGARNLPVPRIEREIRLDRIAFRYPGSLVPVLDGIDLVIPAGCTVALVGPTGAGKTTLVDVLLGLLPPERGRILVDGREIDGSSFLWRSFIGYVPQEIFLCDDSIRRNIAFGVPDESIDDGAVERAARIARLHEFVEGLEARYETVVGERGVRLSGGQRQRIGIARALYRDPPILVLDEATSALDAVTAGEVFDGVRTLTPRKTIVLIAHRLSTVRQADVVHLIVDGRLITSGSCAEVERDSERFRRMATVELAHTGTDGMYPEPDRTASTTS